MASSSSPISDIRKPSRLPTSSSRAVVDHKDNCKYNSYADFLGKNLGPHPELEWLSNFFARPVPSDDRTEIAILDTINGSVQDRGRFIAADHSFLSTLNSRPPESKTRLIITTYEQSWTVERTALDALGLRFDIDPNFFRRHFYYHFIYVEDQPEDNASQEQEWLKDTILQDVYELPSGQRSQFHFEHTRSYHKMSVYIHRDSQSRAVTVLIWMRYSPSNRGPDILQRKVRPSVHSEPKVAKASRLSDAAANYIASIMAFSEKHILAGDVETSIFFYPYAKCILTQLYDDFMHEFNTHKIAMLDVDQQTRQDKFLQLTYDFEGISVFYDEIERIVRMLDVSEAKSLYEDLRHDCSLLKRRFEESKSNYQMMKNDDLLTDQREETRISAQSAISVERLTKIAIVFLPLSFSTSFFGMNIRELGQNTSIWIFFVTAAFVSICCLIPLLPAIVRSILRSQTVEHLFISCRFARHSRKLAFWYLLLYLLLDHDIAYSMFGQSVRRVLAPETFVEDKIDPTEAYSRLQKYRFSAKYLGIILRKANRITTCMEVIEESVVP